MFSSLCTRHRVRLTLGGKRSFDQCFFSFTRNTTEKHNKQHNLTNCFSIVGLFWMAFIFPAALLSRCRPVSPERSAPGLLCMSTGGRGARSLGACHSSPPWQRRGAGSCFQDQWIFDCWRVGEQRTDFPCVWGSLRCLPSASGAALLEGRQSMGLWGSPWAIADCLNMNWTCSFT